MGGQTQVTARADHALTPLYDAARSLLGRESRWRGFLAGHIAPRAHELVVDLHCGEGDLAFQLSRLQPRARVLGIDADAASISRAQARAATMSAIVSFAQGGPETVVDVLGPSAASRVIVTLTDTHRAADKVQLLTLARSILDPLGFVFVIDYGAQRTALMRNLHRAARAIGEAGESSGLETSAAMIRSAGFVAVDEAVSWPTPSGSLSLHRARAN